MARKKIHMDFDPTKDYYKVLGVDPKSTDKQIKETYYKLAKKHHPDVNKGVSSELFKELSAAYDILSDNEKRKKYDEMRNYSAGGFWNSGYDSQSQSSQNTDQSRGQYNQQQNYNDHKRYTNYQNYYDTHGSKSDKDKKWQFTYTDPKTGQRKTINFNKDAFKNFDEFIAKMKTEMKDDDYRNSEAYKQTRDKSRKDPFGHNYYGNNQYQNQQQQKQKEYDENNRKMDFDYGGRSPEFYKKLTFFSIFGTIFCLFWIIGHARRARYYDQQYQYIEPDPFYQAQINQNPYGRNPYASSSYQDPYGAYSYQDPYREPIPRHQPYHPQTSNPIHSPAHQFKPINFKEKDDPYTSTSPPRFR